jgi:hypothetical protein
VRQSIPSNLVKAARSSGEAGNRSTPQASSDMATGNSQQDAEILRMAMPPASKGLLQ